jgi:hypothetical protein
MQTLSLSNVPNQSFSTTLDGNRYDFTIFQANGVMCFNVNINEIDTADGFRITTDEFLIPLAYAQGGGNFLLLTLNDALPDFNQFGITQTLIYLSVDEINAAIASTPAVAQPFTPYALA